VTANDLSAHTCPTDPPNSTYLSIWAGLAAARQRNLTQHQEKIVQNVGKLGTPIFPVWTPQRSSSRERRAQSAPRRETHTNRTVPRVGSVYFFLHVLIFLHCLLNWPKDRLFQPASRTGGEAEAIACPSSGSGCRSKKVMTRFTPIRRLHAKLYSPGCA